MYWRNSTLVDYIIRLAPLCRRIYFGYFLTFLIILIIGIITYTTSTSTIKEFEHFVRFSKQSQLDFKFVNNITEMELSAFRFIYDGHDSAAKNVQFLYKIMQGQLKQASIEIQTDDVKKCLKVINLLLDNYISTFDKVKIQRKLQSSLINIQFRETGTKIEKLLHVYAKLLNLYMSSGDSKLNILQINNELLSVEKNAFRYFDTLDSKYIRFAKQNLKNATTRLKAQVKLEKNFKNYQTITELLKEISTYEQLFLEGVQRTRGYLYLINVVMSADAYEMLYQSRKISGILESNIESTGKNILDNIYRSLSVLVVTIIFFLITMVILSYTIGLSVTRPLNQLTETFNKLTRGSKDKIIINSFHNDEISKLVYAAKMFREKNIEVQLLLDSYKNLNETLETKVEKRTEELKEKNDELHILAITDSLTGIYNRMKLDKVLNEEVKRCKRYGGNFSVIIIDIDNFKSVNDTYGHQVGDIILSEFSHIVGNTVRETDVFGRWGGEEFLILSPQTEKNGVFNLAEKIRQAVESYSFTKINKITASLGVASYINKDQSQTLIERADKALYIAKKNGKNQVKFY